MKNLLLLLLLGFAGYGSYTLWNERYREPQREPEQADSSTAGHGNEAVPKKNASPNESANEAVNEIVTYTHGNLGQILSPIRTQGPQPTIAQVTSLKVKLYSETRKPHSPQATARLQTALKLTGVLEQAVNQRTEHARSLHASEYAYGTEGTSSASKKNFPLSNQEERERLDRTEWWKRGIERKWDDIANQYRTTIEKLLVSLAS